MFARPKKHLSASFKTHTSLCISFDISLEALTLEENAGKSARQGPWQKCPAGFGYVYEKSIDFDIMLKYGCRIRI